ncbi:hypothetical protein AGMMS50239_14010 [Bacteroidia bacterium]|nr:hypothetical protein AGMMS50239_14010 [Bacteroidia bacterium]
MLDIKKEKINCVFSLRTLKYYVQIYSFRKDKEIKENTVYFIVDPKRNYAGLVDRLKSIVGCYYIAKCSGFEFKIISDEKFPIWNYLTPHLYDSRANFNDLSYSVQNSRIISYNGFTINKLNKKIKQYHIYNYNGKNVLETNQIPNYDLLWRNLFQELFEPQNSLLQQLDSFGYKENSYIAIHLRFVNALETFEPKYKKSLTLTQKEILVTKCICGIEQIRNKYSSKKIIVFSDSQVFLDKVKQRLPDIIVLNGNIGHISHTNKEQVDAVINKTFLDFFMIGKASKIFSISASEMYKSVFPRYAAIINNKEYEIIQV